MANSKTWAVELAGGDGARLADVSRIHRGVPVPKQFCSLSGGPTLLGHTLLRAEAPVSGQRIVPVVNALRRDHCSLDPANVPPTNLVAQPRSNRGTVVGLPLPLLEILDRDGLATILVLPSDHSLSDEVVLETAMRQAPAGLEIEPDAIVTGGARGA